MFDSVIRHAKATVETSIGQIVDRTIVAVPFIVAAGFLTTALAAWLIDTYGVATGSLIVGVVFLVVGGIVAALMPNRTVEKAEAQMASEDYVNRASSADADPDGGMWSETEKDVLKAALAASAPHAVPIVLRLVMRNLPIIAAALGAFFIMTRSSAAERPTPAE